MAARPSKSIFIALQRHVHGASAKSTHAAKMASSRLAAASAAAAAAWRKTKGKHISHCRQA